MKMLPMDKRATKIDIAKLLVVVTNWPLEQLDTTIYLLKLTYSLTLILILKFVHMLSRTRAIIWTDSTVQPEAIEYGMLAAHASRHRQDAAARSLLASTVQMKRQIAQQREEFSILANEPTQNADTNEITTKTSLFEENFQPIRMISSDLRFLIIMLLIIIKLDIYKNNLIAADASLSSNEKLKKMPNGSSCLMPSRSRDNHNTTIQVEAFKFKDGTVKFVPRPSNNSVQLIKPLDKSNAPSNNNQSDNNNLVLFESICGWRNSFEPNGHKQGAYWIFDKPRGALVARFDYYDQSEYSSLIEAKLSSPVFKPIPDYHFINDSIYYSSCRVIFKSYVSMRAHLDLFYVPIQMTTSGTGIGSASSRPIGIDRILLVRNKPRSANSDATWQNYSIKMPADAIYRKIPYRLEFSAIPILIQSHHLQKLAHLNGVALANFSLTPQCFGLEVEEQELTKFGIKIDDETEFHPPQTYKQTITSSLEAYKTSILIGVILILIIIIVSSQWLFCSYLAKAQLSWPHQNNKTSSNWFLNLCCCCLCPFQNRHRVYTAATNGKHYHHHHHSNGNQTKEDHQFAIDQQRNNYLRPLSAAIFEDVELNVNPNYLANGQVPRNSSCVSGASMKWSLNNPLEPYFIDRKRLTLTKPLGKGAFGEVYQGYLLCHCSDDGKAIAKQQLDVAELDSLESHSMKVAVKTLTDERMGQTDFIREAINMSLVSHRNIVELIGVCFDEKPLYIVMELLQGGNLKNFLLKNRDKGYYNASPSNNNLVQLSSINGNNNNLNGSSSFKPPPSAQMSNNRVKLCMGDLLVFALDIARACDYLQKRQFIHRDLAARNCLLTASMRSSVPITNHQAPSSPGLANESVSTSNRSSVNMRSFIGSAPSALEVNANHKVDLEQVYLNGYMNSSIVAKLADFGMTRDVYSNDYYRMGHKELPGE